MTFVINKYRDKSIKRTCHSYIFLFILEALASVEI